MPNYCCHYHYQVALSSTFCNFLEADVPGRDFSKLDDAQVT